MVTKTRNVQKNKKEGICLFWSCANVAKKHVILVLRIPRDRQHSLACSDPYRSCPSRLNRGCFPVHFVLSRKTVGALVLGRKLPLSPPSFPNSVLFLCDRYIVAFENKLTHLSLLIFLSSPFSLSLPLPSYSVL